MDSAVASGASIATGNPALRNAAAVTGPTAASAALAASRESRPWPSSAIILSTADGLKKETTSTCVRRETARITAGSISTHASGMIRHNFRDRHRAGNAFKAFVRSTLARSLRGNKTFLPASEAESSLASAVPMNSRAT